MRNVPPGIAIMSLSPDMGSCRAAQVSTPDVIGFRPVAFAACMIHFLALNETGAVF
jgi:hypothetical protein